MSFRLDCEGQAVNKEIFAFPKPDIYEKFYTLYRFQKKEKE
jgi:hypothetical protein